MKKLFSVVVLVVMLSGCKAIDDPIEVICDSGYHKVDGACTLVEIIKDEEIMVHEEVKPIVAIGDDYRFIERELKLYSSNKDSGTTYVNIEDFLNNTRSAINKMDIEKEDGLQLHFSKEMYKYIGGEYILVDQDFTIHFDADKDIVSYNRADVYDYINIPLGGSNYIFVVDETMANSTRYQLNLADYDIPIVEDGGEYFIPFYMLNLLLSGPNIRFFEMNDSIVVVDASVSIDDMLISVEYDPYQNLQVDAMNLKKFTALFFDNNYGLKEQSGVESYMTVLDEYDFEGVESYEELNTVYEQFIVDLDDNHTTYLFGGFGDTDYEFTDVFEEGSRRTVFQNAYNENQCDTRNDEFLYKEDGSFKYFEINSFTWNTGNYAHYLQNVEDGDTVYIDLTCNPGGLVLGVYELLTYMTDKPLEMRMDMPFIDVEILNRFIRTGNQEVDAEYIILVSEATFSAANLFASLVKDNDIGTVIGTTTSGGASPIAFLTLPNGGLLVYSSGSVILNEEGESIEYGIEPDIEYDIKAKESGEFLVPFTYSDFVDYSVIIDRDVTSVEVSLEQLQDNPVISNVSYEVVVSRDDDISYMIHKESFSDDFVFEYDLESAFMYYTFEVIVSFDYLGITVREKLDQDTFDKFVDEFNEDTYQWNVGDGIVTGSIDSTDLNAFKVVIAEEGEYEVINTIGVVDQFDLYDQDGNYIDTGISFDLSPGEYYLRFHAPFEYQTLFTLIYKGNDISEVIIVSNQAGTHTYPAVIDYFQDKDYYELVITEECYLKIETDMTSEQKYEIFLSGDIPWQDQWGGVGFGPQPLETMLVPGTYTIFIVGAEPITSNIRFTLDYTKDDFDGEISDNGVYGELQIGTTIPDISAQKDFDIYTLVLTEDTNLGIHISNSFSLEYLQGSSFASCLSGDILSLSAGTHYFRVTGYDYTLDHFITLIDLSNPDDDTPVPLEMGVEIYTVLNGSNDIDYFTFTITIEDTYTLYGEFGIDYELRDASGTLITSGNGWVMETLAVGTYIVHYNTSIGSDNYPALGSFVLSELDVGAPDNSDLPLDEYSIFLPNYENRVSGYLFGNRDAYYLLEITETQTIKFYNTYGIYIIVDGNELVYDSILLQPGTYFVYIGSYSLSSYNVWYEVRE